MENVVNLYIAQCPNRGCFELKFIFTFSLPLSVRLPTLDIRMSETFIMSEDP